MSAPYWVDIFDEIVTDVRNDADNPCDDTDEPFYMHGHPLEIINTIIACGWFKEVGFGLVPHDKIDRLFWGRSGLYGNEGNIFNDHLDAIEIQNLSLSLRLNKNCIN